MGTLSIEMRCLAVSLVISFVFILQVICAAEDAIDSSIKTERKSADDDQCSALSDNAMLDRQVWLYADYSVLAFGTTGHLLTILFLVRAFVSLRVTKNRQKRRFSLPPVAIYLLPMTASGLMALYAGLLPTLIEEQTCYNTDPRGSGGIGGSMADVKCRFVWTLEYYSIQLYSWLAVCISIERACAMLTPYTYGQWFGGEHRCRCRLSTSSVWVCAIVLLLVNFIPFVSFGIDERGKCYVINHEIMLIYTYVDCVIYSLLPLAVMTPSNALVLWCLACWRRHRSVAAKRSTKTTVNVNRGVTRRAMPLAIASVCLNVALLLTIAHVCVEMRRDSSQFIDDDETRLNEAQFQDAFHNHSSSTLHRENVDSHLAKKELSTHAVLLLLGHLRHLIDYRWELKLLRVHNLSRGKIEEWYRDCSSQFLRTGVSSHHITTNDETWSPPTTMQLLGSLNGVLRYLIEPSFESDNSDELISTVGRHNENTTSTTNASQAFYSDSGNHEKWFEHEFMRQLCYLRPLLKHLWDMELENNESYNTSEYLELGDNNGSSNLATAYGNARYSNNEDEWPSPLMEFAFRMQSLLERFWKAEQTLIPRNFEANVVDEIDTYSSNVTAILSSDSYIYIDEEYDQGLRHQLKQLLLRLRLLLEQDRLLQQQQQSEALDHSLFKQIAWTLGMLSSYIFCSGSFYVYLAVSVAFRQSAKQLLRNAAVNKFALQERNGSLSGTFKAQSSDNDNESKGFATPTEIDSRVNDNPVGASVVEGIELVTNKLNTDISADRAPDDIIMIHTISE